MTNGRVTLIALALALNAGVLEAGSPPQQGITSRAPAPVREVADSPGGHPEDAAVRIPLDAYLRGHETGDAALLRRAFAPDARLWWARDGQVATRTTEEYIAAVSGRRAAGDEGRRRLVSVEIGDGFAVATFEISYPGARLTDQLTLARIGEEWRITSKSFRSAPHPTAT